MNEPTGIVFDIQRAALHDGPGIRTAVFLKGCPLRCRWCHNPESWALQPQVAVCGDTGKIYGQTMTVGTVMGLVLRDRPYYVASGGGLTVSGGEPTVQFDFCLALLRAARAEGIHTCLDTCGHNQTGKFLELLPDVDLFLWDYKATGAELHRALTGADPHLILHNLDVLYDRGARIRLRCPLVPGVNDLTEHFRALAELARRYPHLDGVELLPYHNTGQFKYEQLGLPVSLLSTHVPTAGEQRAWQRAIDGIPT